MRALSRSVLAVIFMISFATPYLASAAQSSQVPARSQAVPSSAPSVSPRDRAWQIIKVNLSEKDAEKRAIAVQVLGLLPGDSQAESLAEKSAADEKPAVRAAAANSLGEMHTRSSVDRLHALLDDQYPTVVLAAAAALAPYKDPAAYEVYYEVLTGERKTGAGITEQAKADLRDPKKLAVMGFEQGIGFVPYAGIGWGAFEALHNDDASPVRAAAAKILMNDADPDSGRALIKASTDKSWKVRTAALDAIAKRGDPKLLDGIVPALLDDNTSVRCTASAAVIRLSALAAKKRNVSSRNSNPNAK